MSNRQFFLADTFDNQRDYQRGARGIIIPYVAPSFFHQLRKFYDVYVDDIGRNAQIEKKRDGRETGEPLARSS